MASCIIVPIGTSRFDGTATWPVTVVILSIKGFPSTIASAIAAAVATFITIAPMSIGSPPLGTSLPVTAFIICFSLPCGYFVLRTCTSTPFLPFAASAIALIASGLLSSIATTPLSTPSARIQALSPSIILRGLSSISLWSHVM